jgi:hypothetical protein
LTRLLELSPERIRELYAAGTERVDESDAQRRESTMRRARAHLGEQPLGQKAEL